MGIKKKTTLGKQNMLLFSFNQELVQLHLTIISGTPRTSHQAFSPEQKKPTLSTILSVQTLKQNGIIFRKYKKKYP
jgi:hypothetical protein